MLRSMSRQLYSCQRSLLASYGSRQYSYQQLEGEQRLYKVLREKFPKANVVVVEDISGGCGAMYDIKIESEDFVGLRKVKQHMLINEALKDEIKDMHGLRINTYVPQEKQSS